MKATIGNALFELVEGDIAEQDTDAVVTAAHWKLQGGDGTDGVIHSKGGPTILAECRRIGSCPVGGAVVTGAGKLKAHHVIHAVGPIYTGDNQRDAELLSSAYQSSLRLADKHGLRSIAFPSISTSAFGYPMRLAAPVAVRAICDFLAEGQHGLSLVRLVFYPYDDADVCTIYRTALARYLSQLS
jgi:O-acetyl-ADP-ribose deacetylase (regulator of RNase III)